MLNMFNTCQCVNVLVCHLVGPDYLAVWLLLLRLLRLSGVVGYWALIVIAFCGLSSFELLFDLGLSVMPPESVKIGSSSVYYPAWLPCSRRKIPFQWLSFAPHKSSNASLSLTAFFFFQCGRPHGVG